jgi:hypothetical protein
VICRPLPRGTDLQVHAGRDRPNATDSARSESAAAIV